MIREINCPYCGGVIVLDKFLDIIMKYIRKRIPDLKM